MKFYVVAATAALFFATTVSASPEASGLDKRACTPSKCLCNKVQGQFCGTSTINPDCVKGHVYECNGQTGETCDFGIRTSCVQCNKLSC